MNDRRAFIAEFLVVFATLFAANYFFAQKFDDDDLGRIGTEIGGYFIARGGGVSLNKYLKRNGDSKP